MKNTLASRLLFWGMLSLYFLFIGYEVLSSYYLFTDEPDRLWFNANRQDVNDAFHTQGRPLGGRMVGWLFARAHTVGDIRWIRLLSLGECLLLAVLLFLCGKRWQRWEPRISDPLIYLTVAIVATSLPFTNWVHWSVSVIIPVAAILSLLAGSWLYGHIRRNEKGPGAVAMPLVVMVLGVAALFYYQSPYPLLLLPFYLQFLVRRDGIIDRNVRLGVVWFWVILIAYFLLFKLSLRMMGLEASGRTELASDLMERISFFIGYPMNQAFNGNVFFEARSLVSQAVFPVLLVVWVWLVLRRGGKKGRGPALRYLLGVFAFWILGFAPELADHEHYAAYRTMLVLTLMVSLALADVLLGLMPSEKARGWLTLLLVGLLALRGAYNYRTYVAAPLSEEYRIVRQEVREHYHAGISRVAFVMAPMNGFEATRGISPFTDEFGMPSTCKAWAPESLVREIVYEMTGSRAAGERLKVSLFTTSQAARDSVSVQDPQVMLIDMPKLLTAPLRPAKP